MKKKRYCKKHRCFVVAAALGTGLAFAIVTFPHPIPKKAPIQVIPTAPIPTPVKPPEVKVVVHKKKHRKPCDKVIPRSPGICTTSPVDSHKYKRFCV